MPDRVPEPVIRTTGKGCMRGSDELTGMVSATTLERPLASVTRSWTLWLPAAENVVLVAGPPATNAPVPARSQAKAVIGLPLSVELETNETVWPTRGLEGNQVNDAAGAARAAAGAGAGPTTTKVLVALTPTLPAESDCSARTVYVPGAKPPKAPDHPFPLVLTVMLWSGTPPAVGPENSLAVTCGRSSSSVPAPPPTACDELVVELPVAGLVSVTFGGTVSITKLNRSEVPTSSVFTRFRCVATAVYAPSGNEGLAAPEAQAPRVPAAVAIETGFGLPSTCAPAKISMVIGVMSLALPVKDGVALLIRVGEAFNATLGAPGSTSKWIGALAPVGFLRELSWVAIAVYACCTLSSAGVAAAEVQAPESGVAVAVAIGEPV